jgi:hypothetical protein
VFPVRYKLNSYIFSRSNSAFKGLILRRCEYNKDYAVMYVCLSPDYMSHINTEYELELRMKLSQYGPPNMYTCTSVFSNAKRVGKTGVTLEEFNIGHYKLQWPAETKVCPENLWEPPQ